MNNEQQRTYDQAQVMLAFARGEKIEYRWGCTDQWVAVDSPPLWNWVDFDYRIAPPAKNKVKLLAYYGDNRLFWINAATNAGAAEYGWKRVPSEDKEVEVEE